MRGPYYPRAMTTLGVPSFAGLPPKMAVMQAGEKEAAAAPGGRSRGRKAPPPRPASHHQPPPLAVARRNARERNRVKQVNNGFATLRQHIPASIAEAYATSGGGEAAAPARGKKLSKVETLRMAVDYIRSLQRLLSADEAGVGAASPATSTVEFSFAVEDGGVGAADEDLGSADGSASPFSLRQLGAEESLSPDGRYLQPLYAAQPLPAGPGVVVKQECPEEVPPPGAVDRAMLEMMWWEQARRFRLISTAPPSPS